MDNQPDKDGLPARDQVLSKLSNLYGSVLLAALLMGITLISASLEDPVILIPDTKTTCGMAILLLVNIWEHANRLKATLKKVFATGTLVNARHVEG